MPPTDDQKILLSPLNLLAKKTEAERLEEAARILNLLVRGNINPETVKGMAEDFVKDYLELYPTTRANKRRRSVWA